MSMTSSLERFPLTPALSRREREKYPPMVGNGERLHQFVASMRDLGIVETPQELAGE